MEVENKQSIIIPIISNYDVSKGDFFFSHKISGTYSWSVQVRTHDLAGVLNGIVTLMCSNSLEDGSSTYFSQIPAITAMTLNTTNGSFVKEDFRFSFLFMGIKFEQKGLISGNIDIDLVLNRTL
jgi:hypothetical protein